MDILEMGASMLSDKLGLDLDLSSITAALGGLLANESGKLDLGALAGKMASSGELSSVIGSWLGDGANQSISADSIMSIFGSDKIGAFADQLGVDAGAAAGGLADVIPEIIDKSSSGGSLLDMAGGAEGLLGAAKGFFS